MSPRMMPNRSASSQPIAVVGMACRFPGAPGPLSFWRLLRDGTDAITEIPPERFGGALLDMRRYGPRTRRAVRRAGLLDQVDQFDPYFFGISPREATFIDPQHRLSLEVAWEALEDAGIAVDRLAGSGTGVFLGLSFNDYEDILFGRPDHLNLRVTAGGSRFSAAGRISYCLNLVGPSLLVDTACSSSLVAVHLACQSLRSGECPLALAGGVNLMLQPHVNVCLARGRALSPDGRCKFGDASADGYGRSEGVGMVVLKPLSAALADRDRVYAVISGSAVNHKGSRDGAMVTPSQAALEAVMRTAYANAGIAPGSIQYVEAHGTGTAMGDLAEILAIGTVVGEGRHPDRPCAIGSVKTNIGHAESASGMAGLIKLLLCFQHRAIPPSLHFHRPNPAVPWNQLPVRMQTELAPWSAEPARAGVSNFGISGTNAHVVLEEPPAVTRSEAQPGTGPHVLCLSARSEGALRQLAARYTAFLRENPQISLADVCFTAHVGRAQFPHRLAVVAPSAEEACSQLAVFAAGGQKPNTHASLPLLARRYIEGQRIDWSAQFAGRPVRKTSLPTYPFERQRYWIDSPSTGARVKGRPSEKASAERPGPDPREWLYELRWEPRPAVSSQGPPATEGPVHWLLLADRQGVADALAGRLRSAGHTCTLAYAGSDYARIDSNCWQINPVRREHFERLLGGLAAGDPQRDASRLGSPGGPPGPGRVVHLWCLDDQACAPLSGTGLDEALRTNCAGVLNLIQAFAGTVRQPGARLWLVTQGAQPVADNPLALAQAPLWGLGRVAALELPEWWGGMVDLDPAASPDASAACLLNALHRGDGEDQIVYRSDRPHVARLVPAECPAADGASLGFDPDAAYLITGGLGRLGVHVAGWMLDHGARHLALMGRHGPDQGTRTNLGDLQARGANILCLQGDVAVEEDLARCLREMAAGMPALRGVVHAAGVTRFDPLTRMSRESLEEVLRAKTTGAWNLHLQTVGLDLECFVLFSSAAAIWGSQHMAHYAAANQFLDVLAHYRRSFGLPALSVNFARLTERGMQSRELEASLAAMGVHAIPVHHALRVVGALLREGRGQATMALVEWPQFKSIYASRALRPVLDRMSACPSGREAADGEEEWIPAPAGLSACVHAQAGGLLAAELAALPIEERKQGLIARVGAELAEVLGFDHAQRVDINTGFFQLGLDSLAALKLRSRLEATLGCSLPAAVLFDRPSVASLAEFLAAQIPPPDAGRGSQPQRTAVGGPSTRQPATPVKEPDRSRPRRVEKPPQDGLSACDAQAGDVKAALEREVAAVEELLRDA
jgi:acyl transferase domain-containing protein/acyl carrier protein